MRRRRLLPLLLAALAPVGCQGALESSAPPLDPSPPPGPLSLCQPNLSGPSLSPLAPCCVQPNYVRGPATLKRWAEFPLRVSVDTASLQLAGDVAGEYRDGILDGLVVWSLASRGVIGDVEVDFDRPDADLSVVVSEAPGKDDACYFDACDGQFSAVEAGLRQLKRGIIWIYPENIRTDRADLRRYVANLTGHEMGHALGLGVHSEDSNDLMFERQSRAAGRPYPWVTERDLNTLGTAYCR